MELIIAGIYHRKTKRLVDMYSKKFCKASQLFVQLHNKDSKTAIHSLLVAGTNLDIADNLPIKRVQEDLFYGGLLHDIGKIEMPDEILKGECLLKSMKNREIVNQHVMKGVDILLNNSFPPVVVNCAAYHHERNTGTGYPFESKAPNIPIEGLLTGISDIFNALLEDRPYRPGFSLPEILKLLEAEKDGFDEVIWNNVICNGIKLHSNSKNMQHILSMFDEA